jgi:hypothetical protein
MGWTLGKSRGRKCGVCKKYVRPHGMGPHMVKHKRVKQPKKVTLDINVDDLHAKVAALREEADQIEAALLAVAKLRKVYAKA